MKKNIIKLIGLLFLIVSCDNIEDVNVDPDSPSAAIIPAAVVYPEIFAQTHTNNLNLNSRTAGIIMQQFEGIEAQQADFTRYLIGESDIDDGWDFGFYGGGAMTSCQSIIDNSSDESAALANLYMAVNLGMVTSMWGDAPFKEAFKGATQLLLKPTFDSQESIYESIQELLTKAIESNVKEGLGAFNDNGADWEKIAHSLKARYYLHLTSVNPNAASLALSEATQGLTNVGEQYDFQYVAPPQTANPLFFFNNSRPGTLKFSASFKKMLEDSNDPRLNLYTNADEVFIGTDLFWGRIESPNPLISFWEVKFIEAEALLRTGADDATVLAPLLAAVRANMEYVGVPESNIVAYLSTISLMGSLEDKLEVIITEKYKSFYGNTPLETWNDFRRTGYPSLEVNADAATDFYVDKTNIIIPRRYLYPISERTTNGDSYRAAIESQGGHLLDNTLWAYPLP